MSLGVRSWPAAWANPSASAERASGRGRAGGVRGVAVSRAYEEGLGRPTPAPVRNLRLKWLKGSFAHQFGRDAVRRLHVLGLSSVLKWLHIQACSCTFWLLMPRPAGVGPVLRAASKSWPSALRLASPMASGGDPPVCTTDRPQSVRKIPSLASRRLIRAIVPADIPPVDLTRRLLPTATLSTS